MGYVGPETRNRRPISKKVQRRIKFRALKHFAGIAAKSVQPAKEREQKVRERERDRRIRQGLEPLTVADASRYRKGGKLLNVLMDRLLSGD